MALERDFPAVAGSLSSIRRAVDAFAVQSGAGDGLRVCVVQAVHEAAANAVTHAYAGGDERRAIGITGLAKPGWLRFLVSDTGPGFRPSRASPGYGLGLAIISQLADELEIRDRADGGLNVAIAFRLQP